MSIIPNDLSLTLKINVAEDQFDLAISLTPTVRQ